ncbi:MAG TPA: MauE/DoxX family redox-associated membrane protein [Nocardioidaceae bacterium]|nr:MauE/DoxX family redox-associated membrane protein [Nocardioidaceae bacterium]
MTERWAAFWRWGGLVARLVVGGVWIVAGWLKLPDPAESVRAVRAYDLLPEAIVPTVGHGLPILEIIIGVMLVAGAGTRVAAAVSFLLQVAFIIGIASAWARGLKIDCGCFGGGGASASASVTDQYPWDIARDTGLAALSLLLFLFPRTALSADRLWTLDPDPDPDHDEEFV